MPRAVVVVGIKHELSFLLLLLLFPFLYRHLSSICFLFCLCLYIALIELGVGSSCPQQLMARKFHSEAHKDRHSSAKLTVWLNSALGNILLSLCVAVPENT